MRAGMSPVQAEMAARMDKARDGSLAPMVMKNTNTGGVPETVDRTGMVPEQVGQRADGPMEPRRPGVTQGPGGGVAVDVQAARAEAAPVTSQQVDATEGTKDAKGADTIERNGRLYTRVRNVHAGLLETLGHEELRADFEGLRDKHPNDFKTPLDAQLFVEEVTSSPDLLVMDDPKNRPSKRLALRYTSRWGLAAIDVQDGEIKSAYPLGESRDVLAKIRRAEREGGSILIPGVKQDGLPGPATAPFNAVSFRSAVDIIRQKRQEVKPSDSPFIADGERVVLEDGTEGTVQGGSDVSVVVQKPDGKKVRVRRANVRRVDVSNDPLDIMRSDLRLQGGVRIPEGATGPWWEDFGFTSRPQPGLFSRNARLSWDQFAQQYPDLFKDDRGRLDFTPDRFGQLVRGQNAKTIASPQGTATDAQTTAHMISEMPKKTDSVPLFPQNQQTGTLVYKNSEWHMVKENSGQTVLKDGGIIPVGDQETVRVAGYFNPKDTGYDQALAEYEKQEAVKKLSPEAQHLVNKHGSMEKAAWSLENTMDIMREHKVSVPPETLTLLQELRGETGDLFGATETAPAPKTAKKDMLPGIAEEQRTTPENTGPQDSQEDIDSLFRFSSTDAPEATRNAASPEPTPDQRHIMNGAVESTAAAMAKVHENANPHRIFDDVSELPTHMRDEFNAERKNVGPNGEVHGAYDPATGTTWLHRPDIIRRAQYEGTSVEFSTEQAWLHETGTHRGSDVLFGKPMMRIGHLNRVWNAHGNEIMADLGHPLDAPAPRTRQARANMVEDWFARKIEAAGTPEGWRRLTNADRGLLRPVWQGVRRVLRRAGLVRRYNEYELNALAHAMYTGVLKGRGAAVKGYERTFGKMDQGAVMEAVNTTAPGVNARFSSFRRKDAPDENQKGWGTGGMSERARQAIDEGKRTAEMIAKEHGLKPATVEKFLVTREAHHVLKEGKKTPDLVKFYDFDPKNDIVDRSRLAEIKAHEQGRNTTALEKRTRTLAVRKIGLAVEHDKLGETHVMNGDKPVGSFRSWGFDASMSKDPEAARRVADAFGLSQNGKTTSMYVRRKEGDFGPIFDEYKHDVQGAIDRLMQEKRGEAVAALHHPELGDIDLVWGETGPRNKGYGLAKIADRHPEVLYDLQNLLSQMRVVQREGNSVVLDSPSHTSVVKLDWKGKDKRWLLTAYEKGASPYTGRIIDVSSKPEGPADRQAPQPLGDKASIPPPPPDGNPPSAGPTGESRHSSVRRPVKVEDIPKPVALPELTGLARDLLGSTPGIMERLRIHGGRALGVFHGTEEAIAPSGKIDLKGDIFIGPQIAARRTRTAPTVADMAAFRAEVLKNSDVAPEDLVVRRSKNGTAVGLVAYKRDHDYAGAILGHEIGHAAGWLDDNTLKRGNILGHIAALHRYMSATVGTNAAALTSEQRAEMRKEVEKAVRAGGTPGSDPGFAGAVAKEMRARIAAKGLFDKGEIVEELKALTHWWSPFDAEKADKKYKDYRYSAKELYAEALSVMFNQPEQLAERAPTFMKAFQAFAETRPEVKAAYSPEWTSFQGPGNRLV
jgi:hypothetical protein